MAIDFVEDPQIDFVPDTKVDFVPDDAPAAVTPSLRPAISPPRLQTSAMPEPIDWNAAYLDIATPTLPLPGQAVRIQQEARAADQGFGVIDFDRGADIPKLDSETVSQALGTGPTASAVIAGSQRAVAGAVEFFTTPDGIATLGLGALPTSAQKAVAGAFAAHMASEMPQQLGELVEAFKAGDVEKAAEIAVTTGLTTAFVATGAKAALESKAAPLTAIASARAKERFSTPQGIVPPLTRKMAERQHGESLIDEDRIKTAKPRKDVMPGRDIVASPEFEFRGDPVAGPMATKINEVDLLYRFKTAHNQQEIEVMKRGLSETDRQLVTKAMDDVMLGKDAAAIDKLPDNLKEVAQNVRQFFDRFRNEVRASREASVFSELTGPEANAVRQVLDGMPLEEAAAANGLRDAGKAIVDSAAKEIAEARTWGLDDYITHVERGDYRVVTPDGGTIAIAETRAEAAIKADKWLKEHPGEVESLTIDNEFNPGVEFPTQLSRGQYFRLVQRLSEKTATDAVEIQELLHKRGSIVAVKPTNKFAGPMEHRKGVLKGEEDLFDVLPLYAHVMNKKLVLDPVLKEARNELPKMAPQTQKQMKQLIDDVKGRKTIGDEIADAILAPLGTRPFAFSRGVSTALAVTRINKLGGRPVAAAVNRISGLQHTWVKTGTKNLVEGRAWVKTPEGEAAFERNKPFLGVEATFIHEAAPALPEGKLAKAQDIALWMFQKAEMMNRPEAFGAFYKQAVNDYKMAGPEAEVFARKAVRTAQFTYNMASLPRMMRGPAGRLVFQFKPFLVKELEFIAGLRGAEIPRYIASTLVIGGPQAAIYMIKTLPILGVLGFWDDIEDWLNRTAPKTSRGVSGALGVDVSPSIAIQFPQDMRDLVGPTMGDIARLWTDVVGPAMQGEDRDLGDVGKWASRLSPLSHYWSDLVESMASEEGWTFDDRGRPEYKPTVADKAKMALGAKPLEKAVQQSESRFLRHAQEIQRRNKTRLVDEFLDAVEKDDGAGVQKLMPKIEEYGVSVETLKAAAKARKLEPKLRLFRSLDRKTRGEEIERFVEPEP